MQKSKKSIDCLPPAACVIIEYLFGALAVLLATKYTQRKNIVHLLRGQGSILGKIYLKCLTVAQPKWMDSFSRYHQK